MKRALVLFACLGLGACTKPKTSASTQSPEAAQAKSSDGAGSQQAVAKDSAQGTAAEDGYPEMKVQLLAAGEEPRTLLRLQPKVGEKVQVRSIMNTVSSTFVGAQKIAETHSPAIVHRIDAQIRGVSTSGIEVDWTSAYSAENAPKVTPKELEKAQAKYAAQGDTHGIVTFNDRGQRIKAQYDRGTEDQKRWAANLVVPFPSEPVGVGARWQTELQSPIEGIDCTVTSTYEVKSIQDGKVTLEVVALTRGKPGPLQSAEVPAGVDVELVSLEIELKGELERGYANFYHEKGTLSGTRDLVMKVKANGQVQEIRTQSILDSSINYTAP